MTLRDEVDAATVTVGRTPRLYFDACIALKEAGEDPTELAELLADPHTNCAALARVLREKIGDRAPSESTLQTWHRQRRS